ncbi:MAG TPA: DUF3037 domain-containing protein [Porphyromonadaceae bacterium]|jgi:hypothetical protein|uniref:DUF3037 domain-containing protein n=1 Tax=Limibacterium fermenti TaxID=3229863 RepID=UPI000E8950A0|nr:DUF3037 domain-containing protein [Porphyromonadaceae bacterium]HBK30565.1 DUF3037 domain-containing protein [Porphyromonadaceae bacterium]HBL32782.1 DUF3037 domain-containing protein [Porphyromonadaceae bacterium]HBX19376.1 DUF3037 domain-containing protein [Porphyromonadaceae bacterium]HBX46915.1 DUF3037 domain-containing protein [Porphyromonadaceae bacterium]
MHKKLFYEYAVIRVVPKVERGEFVNVGIILFCKTARYIGMKYEIDREELSGYSSELDIDLLLQTIASFKTMAYGESGGGEISRLDMVERFRWLTAVRSTCLQTSTPQHGFTTDPVRTLEMLFDEYVGDDV